MSRRAQAVFIGGTFSGVMSALPYISAANCCCLWLISGGVVTAYLMQQAQSQPLEIDQGGLGGRLPVSLVHACMPLCRYRFTFSSRRCSKTRAPYFRLR